MDGVTVELLDAGGSVIADTVTADGGFYGFGNLAAGTYLHSVRFTELAGMQLTSQDARDDGLDSDADPTNHWRDRPGDAGSWREQQHHRCWAG